MISEKNLVPKLLSIVTALSVACIALLIAVSLMTYFLLQKKVQGYAIADNGRVIPLVSLDKPYVTDSRVTGFVEECLRRSFAHDFENFRITMSEAKSCYTPDGAYSFEVAMAPLIGDLRNKSLVMSASFEPTVVTRLYAVNGIVHWSSQTPMTLYRRGGRETLAPLRFVIESTTQRIPLDHDVRGIALRTINLKPA